MQRWFLSYNSQDLALMQGLEAAITLKDPEAKLFFAPKSLRAGGFWLAELAREIADASAFVMLVGEKGLGPWQVIEYYEALDRRVKQQGFPIVLVLLDGQPAPGLPFLRQLHWIVSADPASEKSVAQLMDAISGGGAPPGELWRHTAPYRGLAAMTEADAAFFFGRTRETVEVITALAATPEKLPVLLGNSGVGKSSLAQAGVIAALMRQAWPEPADAQGPWPHAFINSRRWCVLSLKPGTEPVRALVEPFFRTWQFEAADSERARLQSMWVRDLIDGTVTLRDLLDATELRYREELHQPEPVSFLLYVDQGEELYVRAEPRQRQCFSKILAEGLADPRLRALMSLRADFFGELLRDEALHDVSRRIEVPPLRESQLREVVTRPAKLLSARFETDHLAADIAKRAAEDSTEDAGALPLLSYLLDDMWQRMIERGDGALRLAAPSIELGRVLVQRADEFLARNPKAEDTLRDVLTLKLATVREDGEPTRRLALRSEFSEEEWRLVTDLANHPNRLLVTATPENGETYAEVAHEAIFRRWGKLREWIAAEREFLAWRSRLESARRAWQQTPDATKDDALLMGAALNQAQNWLTKHASELPAIDRTFIDLSIARDRKALARARRIRSLVYVLVIGLIAGLVGWINQSFLREQWRGYATIGPFIKTKVVPYVLTAQAEHALKSKDTFRECTAEQGKDYCPAMVVVDAGSFTMGSPSAEKGHQQTEQPQQMVTIAKRFAVSKFELTFDEWDTCVAYGDCAADISDSRWGRGSRPVISVNWDDAERYVAWLAKVTGKPYRLLNEAEYEYATRAGTLTVFPWGNDIGKHNANCDGCGNPWDNTETQPVGSFAPNGFGLYDMVGNVWSWVNDCYHPNYEGAPKNGSNWTTGCPDNFRHVVRGGSWKNTPDSLRSASRTWYSSGSRSDGLGFRVARTLAP
jgi:formylglycine-generating enzyme required for sulfatase activity